MHNETTLLLRLHSHQVLSTPLLLINPPGSPGDYQALNIIGVLHDDHQNHTRWQHLDIPVWFGCHIPDETIQLNADTSTVLFLPKGKQRLLAQLRLLAGRIPVNSRLVVIGAVNAGIKSTGKKLQGFCQTIQKLDSARHCQAWSGNWQATQQITLAELQQSWPLPLEDKTLNVTSLPGVFADGHLDNGSRLLLAAMHEYQSNWRSTKSLLDFGCGAGVLSAAITQIRPDIAVTAVDCDAFALQATTATFKNNQITADVSATATPDDLNGRYDLIISNPPFHQGISQTTVVTERFIQRLPKLLARRGQAWIVANRFLNYESKN